MQKQIAIFSLDYQKLWSPNNIFCSSYDQKVQEKRSSEDTVSGKQCVTLHYVGRDILPAVQRRLKQSKVTIMLVLSFCFSACCTINGAMGRWIDSSWWNH